MCICRQSGGGFGNRSKITTMKLFRVLILEDDLQTLSKLLEKLAVLETKLVEDKGTELSVVILSEYKQVERYINKDLQPEFDIVLLDRDCKIGGSFHTLDIKKFGVDKIIGISSMPEYNDQLVKIGITKVIHKDYKNLEIFTLNLEEMLIKYLLGKQNV